MTDADGRSTRAKARRAEREQQILEAATQLIAERGYASTSVADVIDAAGVSRGTFYAYFESRDALFVEIVDRFIAQLRGAVEVIRLENEAPTQALYANIRRVVDLLTSNSDLAKVLFREAIGLNTEVDERVRSFYSFLHRMVVGALRGGVVRGITRQVDEDLVATAIVGCIKEVIYDRVVVGNHALDPDVMTAAIFDFGFNGLRLR